MERNDSLRVFEHNSGFVMTDCKLQKVKLLRTEFTFDHEGDDFLYYRTSTVYQKPDGTTGVLHDYSKAFDSVECYEKGESADIAYLTLNTGRNGGDVMRDITRGVKKSLSPVYWIFDTKSIVPVCDELTLDKFYFDYADRQFHTDEFPKNFNVYDTKEEALSYNTYKVVNEDGSEYEREGVNKLISLDDDQRELVKQFEEICKKMEENDLALIADYDSLAVFNMRKVKSYVLDYNSIPENVSNPEDYEKADRNGKAFRVNSSIEWWSDDNELFIQRKSTENKEK